MTREQHDLIASLHAAIIAKALMAAERNLIDDATIEADWKALWPHQREEFHRQARIAVRASDDAARAVASYEAREIFCRVFRQWIPRPLEYSQLQKAFELALSHYFSHLSDGPFPVRENFAELTACANGVRPVDDDPETVTGHGRN